MILLGEKGDSKIPSDDMAALNYLLHTIRYVWFMIIFT